MLLSISLTFRHTARSFELTSCARDGDVLRLRELLDGGVDPCTINGLGECALGLSAREGHLACIELLLSSGADIEQVVRDGSTPLIIAARSGQLDCVMKLVELGADVDRRDHLGRNAQENATDYAERWTATYFAEL